MAAATAAVLSSAAESAFGMTLVAYARAAPGPDLHIWVGAHGIAPPLGVPAFTIDGKSVEPREKKELKPAIKDSAATTHSGGYVLPYGNAGPCKVGVALGGENVELTTKPLPAAMPSANEGSFTLLLVSCYFEPRANPGVLDQVIRKLRPDLTLFLGDQVYLDLPTFERLSNDPGELADQLERKYRRNWGFDSGIPGLARAMRLAPFACLPDDHEFWNNYPLQQIHLPTTWSKNGLRHWKKAALALRAAYQDAPRASFDVDPLSFCLLDTRSDRDDDEDGKLGALMSKTNRDALEAWADALVAAAGAKIGVLVSGQPLLCEPSGKLKGKYTDYQLSNYEEFDFILEQLDRLRAARSPVLFLTGDVHWGRIAGVIDAESGRRSLVEMIVSPAALVESPGDKLSEAKDWIGGLFGKRDPWPRHSAADEIPKKLGTSTKFLPAKLDGKEIVHKGDQIATLRFTRAGNGVRCEAVYYPLSGEPEIAAAVTRAEFQLYSV